MEPPSPAATFLQRRSAPWLPWLALTLLYTALTLLYFWPLPRLWRDHLGPDLGDPLFNLYVLKWGVHQIHLGLPDVWNANLFYPARGTLTFSDHLLGPAAQLALFETLLPDAIAGYNFLFLSSFVASALATGWVLRRSGLSWLAAGLGGWMYAFSSFRLSQTPHIQILLAQWIPLTLWFWDRLLAERTGRRAALFLLFYLLNLSGGCYYACMVHVPLLAIFVSRAMEERRALVSWRALRLLAVVAVVAAAAIAYFFVPYILVAHELGLVRHGYEIRYYSATFASYFSPAPQTLYFGDTGQRWLTDLFGGAGSVVAPLFSRPENALFAGFLPTILFGIGAVAAWRGRRVGPRDVWARGLALSGVACFALSFWKVYRLFLRLIPGLSGMRVPTRFYAFLSLTLVYFAARGVDHLLARIRRDGSAPGRRAARLALAAGMAVVLALELAPRRLDWAPLPREEELPPVYAWLRDEPSVHALLELPIHSGPAENAYLYAATVHWKPIVNGFSGYVPPLHERLVARMPFLPKEMELALLRSIGVTHLLVHAGTQRDRMHLRRWEARFASGPEPSMEPVYADGDAYVYRFRADPGAPLADPAASPGSESGR